MAQAKDNIGVAVSGKLRVQLSKSNLFIHVETKNSYPKAISPSYDRHQNTYSNTAIRASTYHIKTILDLNIYVKGSVGGVFIQAGVGSRKVRSRI